MIRIAIWSSARGAEFGKAVSQIPDVEVDVVPSASALVAAVEEAEVLVTPDGSLTPDVLEAIGRAPKLAWIQLGSAGYDRLQASGVRPGVMVSNASAALGPPVADHAVMLLLSLLRRLPVALRQQQAGDWSREYAGGADGLDRKTVTILGFGQIGQETARRLRPFGARIVGVSRTARPNALADEVAPVEALPELLPRSDALVVAVPLSPGAGPQIGADELALLPPHAVLVNVSRGGVVDGAALVDALSRGALAGAALDVTDPEPLPPGHPLWTMKNVIVTPHVAGSGGPAVQRRLERVISDNIRRYARGERPAHLVELGDPGR
ncbi:NAD(P)-dependent oxidoreductase [Roseitranquillus sediminis]|uniref:NAD(P)-dependent oxidoreductase n=1 Tax=Roseitranquillus sediminis TaxID=2809051 RepID=UPI001D0C3C4E|nr:D-2-hydroxyacid dehydrogenase [Roseitranquillus sediminis]MBM9593014.1 D-2-hydroxyacid dehydrogenase [Roseitranquillus sediminis]